MDDMERIANKLKGQDPATMEPDVLTKEEWAVLEEHANEQAVKYANLESIMKWVNLTNYLPAGILTPDEKVEMMKLVLSRIPEDWRNKGEQYDRPKNA